MEGKRLDFWKEHEMKNVLILTVVLLFGASLAFAQAGSIGIYSDETGTSCNLTAIPGLAFYYFLHVNTTGARVSEWAAPVPACFAATYLGYYAEDGWTVLGNPETGVSIAYAGDCFTGTFVILKALYSVTGSAPTCCHWTVGPNVRLGRSQIEGSDCDFHLIYPAAGKGIINATPTCPCGAVPTEQTTWGGVKALYAE